LFKKILVPLPSEYFPELAIKRAVDLAAKLGSRIYLLYIMEQQVIDKLTRGTSHALTDHDRNDIECILIEKEMNGESKVMFKKAEKIAKPKKVGFNKFTCKGIHTDEILKIIESKNIDLIISEFHPDALLKYRIFYESPIPVWIERSPGRIQNIYGICTNLGGNKRVPEYVKYLATKFGSNTRFHYVLDMPKSKATKEVIDQGYKCLSKIHKKYNKDLKDLKTNFVTQDILKYLKTGFNIPRSDLLILGHFEKKSRILFQTVDRKINICKKIPMNVLILK
jgi:nucleotide-binding universal stress UspA family protein